MSAADGTMLTRFTRVLDRTRQGFHEGNEVETLLLGQLERQHKRGPARTIDAALFIMFHRVVQSRRRCVVHVGRMQGHRSKRWGLEGELHQWMIDARKQPESWVLINAMRIHGIDCQALKELL